jgi:hypothetical protein
MSKMFDDIDQLIGRGRYEIIACQDYLTPTFQTSIIFFLKNKDGYYFSSHVVSLVIISEYTISGTYIEYIDKNPEIFKSKLHAHMSNYDYDWLSQFLKGIESFCGKTMKFSDFKNCFLSIARKLKTDDIIDDNKS